MSNADGIETTRIEIQSWYLWDFALSAYFYSVLNFFPLLVTSQAKATAQSAFCGECLHNEWAVDFENTGSCIGAAALYSNQSTCNSASFNWKAEWKSDAKFVDLFGVPIAFASFPLYCTIISVLLQLVVYTTLGSVADYGSNRKCMLTWTTVIGTVATTCVAFTGSDHLYWLSGLLNIISSVVLTFAVVFHNAYLPLLAKNHPLVTRESKKNSTTAISSTSMEKKMTHSLSSRGLMSGFLGQILYLLLNLAIFKYVPSGQNHLSLRVSIVGATAWIAIFGTTSLCGFKTRDGPPLPSNTTYVRHSLLSAKTTLLSFRNSLTELAKFLIAYFVFSDGVGTVGATATVFAQEELGMVPLEIGMLLIEVSCLGISGCYFFMWLNAAHNVPAKSILLLNLGCMGLVPLYAMFGLHSKAELYAAAGVFGFNFGSQQAFTRSLFSQFVPSGHESEYFAFFELSDKGTAWLGPLVVGLVFQKTGSYRDSFSTLVGFFVVGIALLARFEPRKAGKERKAFESRDIVYSHLQNVLSPDSGPTSI